MKVLCISASNILHSKENSTSQILCSKISEFLREKEIACEILDLRTYLLYPCIGCGKCFKSKRCCGDSDFNIIYEKVIEANALDTIQCKTIPFNSEWNTGISLPVQSVQEEDSIFPIPIYDWNLLIQKIRDYIEIVLKEV